MSKSPINTKSVARLAAVQTIYQIDYSQKNIDIDSMLLKTRDFYKNEDINSNYDLVGLGKIKLRPSYSYLGELVKFTHENINDIDEIIIKYLIGDWTLARLPSLLLAVIRIGVCELKYFPETPTKVIINEYTGIAADMLNDNEVGFVNSVLDKFAANHR